MPPTLWPDTWVTPTVVRHLSSGCLPSSGYSYLLSLGSQYVEHCQQLINISIHSLLILLSCFGYTWQGNRAGNWFRHTTGYQSGTLLSLHISCTSPLMPNPCTVAEKHRTGNVSPSIRSPIYDPEEFPNHALYPVILWQLRLNLTSFFVMPHVHCV